MVTISYFPAGIANWLT